MKPRRQEPRGLDGAAERARSDAADAAHARQQLLARALRGHQRCVALALEPARERRAGDRRPKVPVRRAVANERDRGQTVSRAKRRVRPATARRAPPAAAGPRARHRDFPAASTGSEIAVAKRARRTRSSTSKRSARRDTRARTPRAARRAESSSRARLVPRVESTTTTPARR